MAKRATARRRISVPMSVLALRRMGLPPFPELDRQAAPVLLLLNPLRALLARVQYLAAELQRLHRLRRLLLWALPLAPVHRRLQALPPLLADRPYPGLVRL